MHATLHAPTARTEAARGVLCSSASSPGGVGQGGRGEGAGLLLSQLSPSPSVSGVEYMQRALLPVHALGRDGSAHVPRILSSCLIDHILGRRCEPDHQPDLHIQSGRD